MTTGDAAKVIGVSRTKVIRLCNEGVLDFAWTNPDAPTTDVNGNVLRGHRRPYVDSVMEYAAKLGRVKLKTSDEHS